MKNLTLLFLLGTLIFSACTGDAGSAVDDAAMAAEKELRQKMIELHDDVMPYMGEVNNLNSKLTDAMAGVEDSTLMKKMQRTIDMLGKADEGMMDWMQKNGQYFSSLEGLRGEMDHEGIMQFLKKEIADMEDIKEMTENGMKEAQDILDNMTTNSEE